MASLQQKATAAAALRTSPFAEHSAFVAAAVHAKSPGLWPTLARADTGFERSPELEGAAATLRRHGSMPAPAWQTASSAGWTQREASAESSLDAWNLSRSQELTVEVLQLQRQQQQTGTQHRYADALANR